MSGAVLVPAIPGIPWRRLCGWMLDGWTVLRVGLTGMVGWWAADLAYPLATFPTSKAYAEFERICPDEMYWATGFGIAFLVGVVGLWAERYRPRRWADAIIIGSALWLGLNHGMIAWLMGKASPSSTGTGMYAIIMCMSYLLAAREVRRAA